jgi:hypothetical protein
MVYNYLATNYAFVLFFGERKIGEGQLIPTGPLTKVTTPVIIYTTNRNIVIAYTLGSGSS